MDLVKDISKERQKREQPCIFCGKVPAAEHPGYACPRIASVCIDEDGHIWQVEFHDWQPAEPEGAA